MSRVQTKTTAATPKRLEPLARRIERALARVSRLDAGSPRILGEAMRYCLSSGGKRFRPLLCLGGAQAVGGDARQALPVACAIELIHTYSLVHDDLPAMDNASHRRGKPSCHRRFGEAMAILVGDALLTRAFELLGRNSHPNALAIVRTLGTAGGTSGLIGGQVLDLRGTGHGARGTARALEEIARRKTAALITASVVCGGLAGGASAAELSHLRRYGRGIGLAFQLIDDLHDRDGMAAVQRPEAVRQQALALIEQSKSVVSKLGKRAVVLTRLADWLARSAS